MSNYDPNQFDPSQPQPNPYGAVPAVNPKSDKRTLGLWALWTGIASIVIGPFLFGLLSIPPIVLGIIALIKEERSKALGIWGIVLGVIGFVWMFLFWTIGVTLLVVWSAVWFAENLPSTYPSISPSY